MKKPDSAVATSSKMKFDESDENESSSEDEGNIEQELADVTFEDLQKARCNGSHTVFKKPNLEKKGGRANKNRPMEISSKKPVGRFREVIQIPKKVTRDPRFESLSGSVNEEWFKDRYTFVYLNEKEELKKAMEESKDPAVIDQIKKRIAGIDTQLRSTLRKQAEKKILDEHKKKERVATNLGKRPYYLKKSDVRKQKLIEKYKDLKASGKLESYIERRRRKNAAKDRRFMPYRRSNDNEQEN